MNDITNRRIYVQMRPDAYGTKWLENIQAKLPAQKTGRLIGPDELHMTLIHFGKAEDLFNTLHEAIGIEKFRLAEGLRRYITRTETLLPAEPLELHFNGYDLFGPKKNALVARFDATDELTTLHTRLLDTLFDFFNDVGISNPMSYVQNNAYFKDALTLEPHATLYKGYYGNLPNIQLGTIRFEMMELVY